MKFKSIIISFSAFFFACVSYSIIPVNQSFYISNFNGNGIIFAEDKNAGLYFEYRKGNWKITKNYIEKNKNDTTRMIWFVNSEDSLSIGYWYVQNNLNDDSIEHEKLINKLESKEEYLNKIKPTRNYEFIGRNIGNNLLPNYLFKTKISNSITYFADFYSGPYFGLLKVISRKEDIFSKEDFITLFTSANKLKNIDSLDLVHFKKMKASEL